MNLGHCATGDISIREWQRDKKRGKGISKYFYMEIKMNGLTTLARVGFYLYHSNQIISGGFDVSIP